MQLEAPSKMRLCAATQARFAAGADALSPAADLKEALTQKLGERPRRLGAFAQLALAGALDCHDQLNALAIRVPAGTALLLTSQFSVWRELAPKIAAFNVGGQAPTPFEFLAVQGNAACLAVAQRLGIAGPALLLSCGVESLGPAASAVARDAPALFLAEVEMGDSEWTSAWNFYLRDS